jgi:uncharacterized protein (TIGR02594 family)
MDIELLAIQRRLKELGHDPGSLDGIWGADTRRAVTAALGLKPAPKVKRRSPGSAAVEAPWFELARSQLGVKELAGAASNPEVLAYYSEAGVSQANDSVPWCAAFVGAMLRRSGYKGTGSLMARSYLNWGTKLDKPQRGCVVIFKRGAPPAGHVAFVDEWTANAIRCVGGNQSDAVTVASYPRVNVLGYRWPSEALAA